MPRRVHANRAVATYPISVTALLLGIGRNAAYAAAARHDFPAIELGGRIVVVAAPINRILHLSGPDDPRVQEAYRLAGITPPPPDAGEKPPGGEAPAKATRSGAAP